MLALGVSHDDAALLRESLANGLCLTLYWWLAVPFMSINAVCLVFVGSEHDDS